MSETIEHVTRTNAEREKEGQDARAERALRAQHAIDADTTKLPADAAAREEIAALVPGAEPKLEPLTPDVAAAIDASAPAESLARRRRVLAQQPPSVGRIVHFYAPSPALPLDGPYAGIITGVGPDGFVSLMTFGPAGSTYPHAAVSFSETPMHGCWSWPPRLP